MTETFHGRFYATMTPYFPVSAWTKANLVSLGILGSFFEFEKGPYSHRCVMCFTQTQIRKVEMTKTHHGRF